MARAPGAQGAEFGWLVDSLDADAPAEARLALSAASRGRIGLLPGSFNPPTDAHRALAAAGHASGLACVYYLLSKRTVDKEHVSGIPLADRLRLLAAFALEDGDGVAFANRGLYVELAGAMRAALPEADDLVFLVGYDKIVQIFDPRYYADRGAALRELFALASFLVAPRGEFGHTALADLLVRPENRAYAARVAPLELAPEHRGASSTRVRRGESDDVPPVVGAYLRQHRPFETG